jgi:hypothetical protein
LATPLERDMANWKRIVGCSQWEANSPISEENLSEPEMAVRRVQINGADTTDLSRVNSLFDDSSIALRNLIASLSGFAVSHSQTMSIVQPSFRRTV